MKVIEYKEGKDARLVLTGMIVSNQVVAAVSAKWTDAAGLFGVRFMDTIGSWCVKHYRKFHKAPGETILNYYDRWSRSGDRPGAKEVEQFLGGLNAEYVRRKRKTIQADYILSVAENYFTKVRIEKATKEATELIAAGKVEKADALLRQGAKVEMTDSEMIDLFDSDSAVETAWEQKDEVLVEYEGAAKEFFSNRFKRKAFVSFEGMEKSGKSYWLLDVVWRALHQGRKVAYFECGDLSREDVILRIAARAARRPVDCEPYQIPVSLNRGHENECDVVLKDCKQKEVLSNDEAVYAFHKCRDKWGKDSLKLGCYPARSISVNGVTNKLQQLRDREGWVPDVVVVDYSDILAPVNGTAETRDQINTTWILLRALAMSTSSCVVTATQTNRGSYGAEVIDMAHASEDKRKRGHVTASFGINQTDQEKEKLLYRINTVVGRTGKFVRSRCLYAAGSLAIANPLMLCSL